jgi:hypothetical protein
VANTATQFGFRHIGYLPGGAPDYQQSTRVILSTYSTAIGFGDPVQKTNATSQYIVRGAGGTAATGTAIIEGIFVGCEYTPSGGLGIPQWSPYWPGAASADAKAYIIDAPNALFLVATGTTAVATAGIGGLYGFDVGTVSTTGGGFSGATLNATVSTSAGSLPFKMVSLYQGVGNGSDPTTAYNWVVVTFNNQQWKTTSAGGVGA